jgi:hypothetical protein
MTVEPPDSRRVVIEGLIDDLMLAGVWDKLDGLYVFAAHDSQAGMLNWTSRTMWDCSSVNGPVFTPDRGFAGDGQSSYLDTNTAGTALQRYTGNDAALGVYLRTAVPGVANTGQNWVGFSGGNSTSLDLGRGGVIVFRMNSDSGSAPTITYAPAPATRTGLWSVSRDATTATVYRNGASVGSAAVAAGSNPVFNLNLLRINENYSGSQMSAAFFGAGLTATEQTDLYCALSIYMTTIGAAV